MQREELYLNGSCTNLDTNTTSTFVFYTSDWGRPGAWATENNYRLNQLVRITSTMDIKSAYAKTVYRLNFRDKKNNITENYFIFDDNFGQVQVFVDNKTREGLTLNNLTRSEQSLVDLVNY